MSAYRNDTITRGRCKVLYWTPKRARRVIVIIFWYIAGITFSKNSQKPNQLSCVIVAMRDLSLRPKDVIIR